MILATSSHCFISGAASGTEDADSAGPTSATSASASAAAPSPSSRRLRLQPIVPLSIFQLSDKKSLRALFTRVRQLPDLVHYYLQSLVFPAVLQHQTTKIAASGQELGGSMLFARRVGFSGTPSDLLPLELGACGYEQGSEGNSLTAPAQS